MKMFKYLVVVFVVMLSISGCQTPPKTIYYDAGYSTAVYEYLKGDEMALSEQVELLELVIAGAASEGKPVLPGVHAHLGLLYFDSGNSDQGTFHFEQEKLLFPESSHYIDFLLSSAKEKN